MAEVTASVSAIAAELVFHSAELEAGTFMVLGATVMERLGGIFEIEIHLALDDEIPLDEDTVHRVLHAPAALALGTSAEAHAPWFGVLREIELVSAVRDRRALYRAVLVPSLWYLGQTVRSRVFQNESVPDIVAAVLEETGVAFERALNETYPVREHVVQYQESDLDFVSRLCEHEGIFFFFDHTSGSDVVVLADHNGAFREAAQPEVPFDARGDARVDHTVLTAIRRAWRVVPQHVILRDTNYRIPQTPLQVTHAVDEAQGLGLVSLYGDHFKDEAEGNRLARVRAEERALQGHLCYAETVAAPLRPGQSFTLSGHPTFDAFDVEYVVVASRHRLYTSGDEGACVELELLPKSIPFRPARVTRKPRIYGLMHARIDGETDSTLAPIDEQGRYKVLLPVDEAGAVGGRASRWIRRAQPYAGPNYGMHYPLHIGAEVILAHLDGDPDRPIIVGAVPSPATSSPVIDELATRSIVRTKGRIVEEYEDDAR
ncbi:MAG: type VI secretion system tip protein VgrG [Sandaracinaceae bacterium]|nr:type VI secretion system tip protein VgrG [Sandaracinaceae bacterium]